MHIKQTGSHWINIITYIHRKLDVVNVKQTGLRQLFERKEILTGSRIVYFPHSATYGRFRQSLILSNKESNID